MASPDTIPEWQAGRKRATLIAVSIASFLEPLDASAVVMALPGIEQHLGASLADLQWVINAYALTFCAFLMIGGSLADLFGRRRLFVIGLSLVAVTSLLCGLSTTPLMLNLCRGLEGIGAALTCTTTLALLVQEFHGQERTLVFGIWGATIGLSLSFGPLLGGVISQWLGWRWIFLSNVPVCIAAILLTLAKIRESRDPEAAHIGWAGFVTFTPFFFLLLYGLVNGNKHGWDSPMIVGSLAGAGVLFALFLVAEQLQRRPMVDLDLFRDPTFTGASIASIVLSVTYFAFFIYLPLFFQSVLGYSPIEAGLALLPMMVPLFLMGLIVGKLSARLQPRILLSMGLGLVGLGMLRMVSVGAGTGGSGLAGGLLLSGVGAGLINGEMSNVAISVVPKERSGMASGINNTLRQVGYGGGIAVLGAILAKRTESSILAAAANIPEVGARSQHLADMVIAGNIEGAVASVPPDVQGMFVQATKDAFISGMNLLFIVAAVIAVFGAALVFVLVQERSIRQ